MSTYSTILTNTGKALLADAAANGTQLNITTMEVGDGAGNPQVPNPTQAALKRVVYSGTLNSIGQDPNDDTQFIAEFVIPADVGGFNIRELALRTADGDLFAVANTPVVYKPSASEGAYSDTIVKMVFRVDNAATVNVVVDPNISIATRTWVINYAVPANIIPGGLTSQFLAKASNNDGDVTWVDPTAGVQVVVDTIEEAQTLAAGQTAVTLATMTTHAMAVYIEGVRLRQDEWTAVDDTHLTLATSYPAGSRAVFVQNEQTGSTDLLHAANNLQDVANVATARANLGAASTATTIAAGTGLTGGGSLAANRTLSVDFAASGTSSSTKAVRADDSRLSDARAPTAHTQAASTITGTMTVAQGGTGLASLTSGSFLRGNGTGSVTLRTPAQVLSDIGAASASHTHNIDDVIGLQDALDGKLGATATAVAASKLANARAFNLSGVVTAAAVNFDGTGNVTLSTAIADGALSIAKTSGLQTALDGKASLSGAAFTGPVSSTGSITGTLSHSSGYFTIFPYDATYDDGSKIRGYYDGNNRLLKLIGVDAASASFRCNLQMGNLDANAGAFSGPITGTTAVFSGGVTVYTGNPGTGASAAVFSGYTDNPAGTASIRVLRGLSSSHTGWVLRTKNAGADVDALTIQPSGAISATGSITATGGFQSSDRRLKKNIKPRAVLRGIALRMARAFAEWDRIADGAHDVGLVAQVVERIAPWYVQRGSDKRRIRAIDKAGIALESAMDNALKLEEQEKTIKALLRRIEKLERRA